MDGTYVRADKALLEAGVMKAASYLVESKAIDVRVIDLDGRSSIADYFVVATVTSYAQLRGLVRGLQEYLAEEGIPIKSGAKHLTEDIWTLLDCEFFLVHLMTEEAREFYGLEKLWFEGKLLEVPQQDS